MADELKTFEAVFVVKMRFHVEDEKDALAIVDDLAVLEGSELIYLCAVPQPRSLGTIHAMLGSLAARLPRSKEAVDADLLAAMRQHKRDLLKWAMFAGWLQEHWPQVRGLVSEADVPEFTVILVELDPNEGSGVILLDWVAFFKAYWASSLRAALVIGFNPKYALRSKTPIPRTPVGQTRRWLSQLGHREPYCTPRLE